jgi:hypothetical protein
MALGTLDQASKLLQASRGGMVLNTAFIDRFNATMRERPAPLTRTCRHAAHRVYPLETGMYLVGSIYNCCCPNQELRKRSTPGQQKQTPAMASGTATDAASLNVGDALASDHGPIQTCPNGHEDALVISVEYFHRLL